MYAAKNFSPGAAKTFCRRPFMPSLRRRNSALRRERPDRKKKKAASEEVFFGTRSPPVRPQRAAQTGSHSMRTS